MACPHVLTLVLVLDDKAWPPTLIGTTREDHDRYLASLEHNCQVQTLLVTMSSSAKIDLCSIVSCFPSCLFKYKIFLGVFSYTSSLVWLQLYFISFSSWVIMLTYFVIASVVLYPEFAWVLPTFVFVKPFIILCFHGFYHY